MKELKHADNMQMERWLVVNVPECQDSSVLKIFGPPSKETTQRMEIEIRNRTRRMQYQPVRQRFTVLRSWKEGYRIGTFTRKLQKHAGNTVFPPPKKGARLHSPHIS